MTSDKKPVQDFVALCEASGIEHIIITPGSRNAPFSISFWNHPNFKIYSLVDERSAAFFALGIAQQIQKPVVIICTSGSAALNYAPAISEAYYQQIPLLIVTADRPVEWVDQGEGQTIRQKGIFDNYVKGSFDIIQEATDKELARHNVRMISHAIALTMAHSSGPVHLNFPLRESLYLTSNKPGNTTQIKTTPVEKTLGASELAYFSRRLNESGKIMVLTGQLAPNNELNDVLGNFAQRASTCVITETHSNLHHPCFVGTTDRLLVGLNKEEQTLLSPEILITIGQNIISRKIKALLRESSAEHWHIDSAGELLDTFLRLQYIVPLESSVFFNSVNKELISNSGSTYRDDVLKLNARSEQKAANALKELPFSDLTVFDKILQKIPSGSELQMGNSAVVRYIQLFNAKPSVIYRGNRGVSGIDGCTSTAVGAAMISGKLTTLISGDLAFFYDSNAFWNEYVPSNLKIIVVNNGGGGIFRIIDGPSSSDAMERLFETSHERTSEGLASMYAIPYTKAGNHDELQFGLEWLYENDGCRILEIFTPRLQNDLVLKRYFGKIADRNSQ